MLTHPRSPNPAALALASMVALGGGVLPGCSSASANHARDERRMLAALTEARDAVCACRDLDCAEGAEQRLADFLLLHVDSLKKIPAPARSSKPGTDPNSVAARAAAEAARLDGELRACKHRLEEAASAS